MRRTTINFLASFSYSIRNSFAGFGKQSKYPSMASVITGDREAGQSTESGLCRQKIQFNTAKKRGNKFFDNHFY
ncbi:hypothetical protein EV199_0027 [Pseudobacter ginsenosidimutans]|uniref:Uncharacterized protein n=1 Tax=Pseudobacter ginsenosidimutans TaxID=661488 RepID=A0A4Q7MZ09_9BACT|nr:hypothetical protein EV199_0027 [Pseudobacter ginsenosidimutans]